MSDAGTDMQARHAGMLAEVAELSLTLARKLHERAMAAETDAEAQAAAAAFHRISRTLRQTLALEARLARDSRREAFEARRLAEDERRERVKARKAYVGHVGDRLIWTEAERDEVGRLLVELRRWCDVEAYDEEAFLEAPAEAVVARLRRDLGLAAAPILSRGPVASQVRAQARGPAPPRRSSA